MGFQHRQVGGQAARRKVDFIPKKGTGLILLGPDGATQNHQLVGSTGEWPTKRPGIAELYAAWSRQTDVSRYPFSRMTDRTFHRPGPDISPP